MTTVAVCVGTYRRPAGLERLLSHLAEQVVEDDVDVRIVIAENDLERREGLRVIDDVAPSYRWPIRPVHVPQLGVCHVRNAAIGVAIEEGADLLVFIDDDEWPQAQWLQELVSVQAEFDAALVGGPVLPVFPPGTKQRFRTSGYYGFDQDRPDRSRTLVETGANFLATAAVLATRGPDYFDPVFAGRTGEDRHLFHALRLEGAEMRWAADAIVFEEIPEDRLTDSWLEYRVTELTNARVYSDQLLRPGVGGIVERVAKTVALAAAAVVSSGLGVFSSRRADSARVLRWKLAGKMSAHRGQVLVRDEGR